jgi:pimeloyl-ACP methyl ester carboxylesterase
VEVISAPWSVSGRAVASRIEATTTINQKEYFAWTYPDYNNANVFQLRLPNGNWTISSYVFGASNPINQDIIVNNANLTGLEIGEVPPLSPFQSWIQSFYSLTSNQSYAESDPDNDGFRNEMEFAFGSDPSAPTPSLVNSFSEGGNYTMSWLQRDAGDLDLNYFVRESGNLKEWGPALVDVVDAPGGNGDPDGYIRKQFTVPATGRQFYRVLATDNPDAVPDQSFAINVAGTPVTVERWGTGPKAIVFFGYIPFGLEKNLKKDFADEFKALLGSEYSMFLWTFPENVSPYSEALSSLNLFNFDPLSALDNRVNLAGQASSVVQQIRAATGLTEICLVGNSFGAGVILWDFATLTNDSNLRFVLISPSELFMPSTLPSANPLPRTLLVADADNDNFIVTHDAKQYFKNRTNGPLPPGYFPVNANPHFIIGNNFTTLEYVFELIEAVYQQQ